jgi:hypothetical protein
MLSIEDESVVDFILRRAGANEATTCMLASPSFAPASPAVVPFPPQNLGFERAAVHLRSLVTIMRDFFTAVSSLLDCRGFVHING